MRADLDGILKRVAAGELTPEAALALLDESARDEPGGRATRLRITASYRSVDIVGDASIAEAVVSGVHTVRREGGTLLVESQELPQPAESEAGAETRNARFAFASLPRSLAWARAWKDHHLTVRVNPNLPVELDAAGASVRMGGCEAGLTVRLVASALKVDRVRGPLDVDALSSSVKGSVAPTGTSRIVCESSSVKVGLLPGTDVRILARNRMGKVVLPSTVSKGGIVDPERTSAVVGPGTGELTIEAVMSSVVLSTDGAETRR